MPLIIAVIALLSLSPNLQAEPKRVEVYPISQSFVDVTPGDTLGEIVSKILPSNPSRQRQLMQQIVELNPDAFINNNPDMVRAGVRLWLPGHMPASQRNVNREKYTVREFSWGYIQQPK